MSKLQWFFSNTLLWKHPVYYSAFVLIDKKEAIFDANEGLNEDAVI